MTSQPLIGFVTNASVTYTRNLNLNYAALTNQYNSYSRTLDLLSEHSTTRAPFNGRLTVDNMRYQLKHLFLDLEDVPPYAYIFNTKTNKWYVWEAETRGWIAFTKLNKKD